MNINKEIAIETEGQFEGTDFVEEERMLKESSIEGIEIDFTKYKNLKLAITTLKFMKNLRYIKIQQIDNLLIKKCCCLILKELNHCTEIILESQNYFLTEYPRLRFGLKIPDNSESKIGFKVVYKTKEFREELFEIEASEI